MSRSSGAPGSPEADLVVADRLEVAYPGRTVWRDATFRIGRGQFIAVIGPNGAGKTTLFRLLLGLQPPSGGSLRLFGALPHRGNPRVGYVPQRHSIDSETNVACLELVRLSLTSADWRPRLPSRADHRAASEALARVGAAELAEKPLGVLSGGELQRVFLAEALVSDPDLLLLDEPLSNLDLRRSRELVELVHQFVRTRNVTALLVAHDINPLVEHLDQVIYIANGSVATGTPEEVLTSERLSALYGVRVEVLRDSRGNIVIVGTENPHEEEAG